MGELKNSWKLLGSAPTLERLEDGIATFYGGERKILSHQGVNNWWLVLRSHGPTPMAPIENVRVIKKRGRYRFEAYGAWK